MCDSIRLRTTSCFLRRAGTVAKLIYDELLEMKEGAEANS